MQFSEIRSLKKIHRSEEGISTDNIIEARGIVHPITGEIITVGEAISLRILDVRNGRIATTFDGKTSSMTIEEAARMNLIDSGLANRLLGPCGVNEDGRHVSLLEAIQRELLDAERGDDRVKVTYVTNSGVSVADAMTQGLLDPDTGLFINERGEHITIEEAYSRGYLVKIDTTVKIKRGALALADAISQGLVDERLGLITDRNTGDSYLLDEAIKKGIVDPDVREVVDPKSDIKITVAEAIDQAILNPKSGKYVHGVSIEKLSFKEARRRHLIIKPMTLKDCCDLEIIDENGKIASPAQRSKLGILEAVTTGVLDADTVKSVSNTRTGDLLTLSDALAAGIILAEGKFRDLVKGEELSIPEAVDRGLITSVAQKSIFDIDGFKDPITGEFISLNTALLKGLVSSNAGGSFVVDLTTGKTVSLNDAIELGHARPEVMEMLNRGIGITDKGRELSVLDAVLYGLLDPKSGQLLDPRTKKTVPLEDAIKRGLITPDGAALLASLLNITVTTQTVTKTIKKYVTVTETGETITRDYKVAYREALSRGLIDERTGEFTDPDSGKVLKISDAVREGLISNPDLRESERPSPKKTRDIPSKQMIFESTLYARVGDPVPTQRPGSPPKAIGTTTTIITHSVVPREQSTSPTRTSNVTKSVTPSPVSVKDNFTVSSSATSISSSEWSSTRDTSVSPTKRSPTPPKRSHTRSSSTSKSRSPSPDNANRTTVTDGAAPKPNNSREISTPMDFEYSRSEKTPTNYTVESKLFIDNEIASMEKKVFEMPNDGWMLSEAIEQQFFDPVTGLFIIPGTDRLVSFEECVKLEIINPHSAVVIDPNNGRNISVLRSLEKNILDSTGHYMNPQKLTMKEAIAKDLIILEHRTMEVNRSNPKLLQITKVSGKPDRVEVTHVDDPSKDMEIASSEELFTCDPVQVTQDIIYDPATALVIFTDTGKSANILAAVNEGTLQSEAVVVKDPSTGKDITVKEAIDRKILDPNTGVYIDGTGRKISLADAAKFGVVAVLGAPLVAAAAAVEAVKKAMVHDPKTGEKIPREVAIERGLVAPDKVPNKPDVVTTTITVKQPQTVKEITVDEAIEKGIVTPEQVDKLVHQSDAKITIKVQESTKIFDDTDEAGPSLAEKTRSRVTTEPKYKVTIGRARSVSQSPEREAKPIILQKMRKRIVNPQEAFETGLIDKETTRTLKRLISENDSKSASLSEAIKSNKIDSNEGKITDPQTGDVISIKEAINRGILDSDSADMQVPLAKSLSVPGLYKQGLLDRDENKVIHPETGEHLTLNEAIVCEVVNPLSKLSEQIGQNITLEKAIERDIIDGDKSVVKVDNANVNLVEAVERNIFEPERSDAVSPLPPVGMTFTVALQRGLVDTDKKIVTHPITGEHISLEKAIEENLIMALPHPAAPESIEVTKAIEAGLIDEDNSTIVHPTTGKTIPISEALESGVLVVKANMEIDSTVTAVTETITSYHTVTTKTVELLPGYVLLNATEVKNTKTGEVMLLAEAQKQGIAKDESVTREEIATKDIKTTFTDAVEQGLVDMNAGTYTDPQTGSVMPIAKAIAVGILDTSVQSEPENLPNKSNTNLTVLDAVDQLYDEKTERFHDPATNKSYNLTEAMEAGLIESDSVVYDVQSSQSITTKEAVAKGLLDPKTGKTKDKHGNSISVSQAAKLGLLAVVAAPVLAGIAVVDAIKSCKPQDRKSTMSPVKESSPLHEPHIESKPDSVLTTSKSEKIHTEKQKRIPQQSQVPMDISDQEELDTPTIQTTVGEAIDNDLIDPKICRIIVGQRELPYSIQEALEKKEIYLNESIVVISKVQVCLVEERSRFKVEVTRELTAESLAQDGAYDLDAEKFADPDTGNTVAFHDFVLNLEVIDPDNVWVKDLSSKTGEYVSLREAINRPLVDRNLGYMVDPKTGKKIPFFEAIQLGLIVHRPPIVEEKNLALSLKEAIEAGVCDPSSGVLQDPRSGQVLTLANAVEAGLIDPDSVSIRNPVNDEVLPLFEAIEAGIVDLHRGVIINVETRTEIDIKVAFLKGLVVPGLRKPIALEAIINKGLYDSETGQIQDPLTKQNIDVEEGVRRGIVDAFITECKDTQAGSFISLDDALSFDLLNAKTGRLRDTKAGALLPLDVALSKRLIITTPFVPSLIDVIVQEYYSPKTGLVLNPMTGDELTVKQALTTGFVDGSRTKVKDERRDKVVNLKEAQDTRLVDLEKGILLYPHAMLLDAAFEKGYILSTIKPWTLQEALTHQTYNSRTGAFLIDGDRVTLEAALAKGLISIDGPSIKDPRTGDVITLGDAIKHGLIDPKTGMAIDPSTGTTMTLTDALDRGLVVPAKRKISLPEAVFKGFYDPKTGQFTSLETREKLPTDRAIKEGVIDSTSAIVRDSHGDLITFDKAIKERIVDPKKGTITTEKGYPVDFQEAFEQGLLLETRRPMTFSEALLKGILDTKTGLFLDPKTGAYMTVLQAIQKSIIDADSVHVKDPKTGFSKKITLIEAIRMGYVDGTTGRVKDFTRNNMEISLHEAYEIGLLIDNKAAVSLQRAIHQGLYDDKTGKITDPSNGRAVTLHEAMRKCIISPKLACYWDKRGDSLLSLADSCRAAVIDRRSGMFKEPGANCTVPLSTALQLGLIIDIESAGFGLYEAVHMGMYNVPSGKFIHPSTNKKLTLAEACQEELINPLTSIVKNTKTNKYILLEEAISEGIVDDVAGTYSISEIGKVMDLVEAKKKGFIVPFKKNLSIEEAVKCGLYRGDSGKFVDPTVNEFHDLTQALNVELLDSDTTALKDATTGQIKSLAAGIEDGTIDVPKGRVLDPKSKRAYNIDIALERGLLVTVDKPLTQRAERKTSLELQKEAIKAKGVRECSLTEAIRYELLDPNTSVVKDPRTGNFITVAKALEDGVVDPSKKGTIEPQTGKTITKCIRFEEVNVYLVEPITFETAVEKGYLNLETARFTDPKTNEELSLKEAVANGIIDPDSALIKDQQKKKLVKLPEAFRKGIMDGDKGNVLDTSTSKLHTLPKAVETGLLTTQKQGLSFIETLQFGLYNPTTGGLNDPFSVTSVLDRKRLTLADAIESGLVDPSTTVIKDPINGSISSLLEAISKGRIDPVAGRFIEDPEGKDLDFVKALERGFILAAEARVSDSDYNKCLLQSLSAGFGLLRIHAYQNLLSVLYPSIHDARGS